MTARRGSLWNAVLMIGLCSVRLLTLSSGEAGAAAGITIENVSPSVAKPGQRIVIAVSVSYPVTGPCQVTITEVGQSAPLVSFSVPPNESSYTIPQNTPLGSYRVAGTCDGIAGTSAVLTIADPPVITAFGPMPAPIGLIEYISGSGFGTSGYLELLQSGSGPPSTTINTVLNWSGAAISYVMPNVPVGTYSLAVHTAANGTSSSVSPFKVEPAIQYLWVADTGNNRILQFPAPPSTGAAASLIIGPTLMGQSTPLNQPAAVARDAYHNALWIADTGNSRILQMSSALNVIGTLNDVNLVLGQAGTCTINPVSMTSMQPATPSSFCNPNAIMLDANYDLWVSDSGNNRILEFLPPYNQGPALVIGQKDFVHNSPGTSKTTLFNPRGLAFDPSGDLWVADTTNNRVLEFLPPFKTGQAAAAVFGQTNFTNNGFNQGYDFTQQSSLANPSGVAFDSASDLWIVDTYNNRVLEFQPLPAHGAPLTYNPTVPNVIIGQPGAYSGDNFSPTPCPGSKVATQTDLCLPSGAFFDGANNLWVADRYYNRVLEFVPVGGSSASAPAFSTNQAASTVLGQIGYSQTAPNSISAGMSIPGGGVWWRFNTP